MDQDHDQADRRDALKLLRAGTEGIAEWNRRYPFGGPLPDLTGVDLAAVDLSGIHFTRADLLAFNLSGVNLTDAYLTSAELTGTDLTGANLTRAKLLAANLTGAKLNGATLIDADLFGSNLTEADLTGANLTGAKLNRANLTGANLQGANLTSVDCNRTVFGDVDLSQVIGLETVQHIGPSTVGIDTLIMSNGRIAESFLRGCGIPEEWITYLPAMLGMLAPIQFYSCFISYSVKDDMFAQRLYADLQAKNVRCWFAPEDLKIGAKLRVALDESIRVHDKLLLILSKHSVASAWVEKEVETAMERERRDDRIILFPIRLDDAVMKAESGWPADIRRSRHIGDFKRWKGHDSYTKSLDRLLRDLNQTEPAK